MEIKIVIGAGFGDCGKGRMTDYLSDKGALVIRFNGGAQAGHTVVLPDGKRYVFHHIGSGTMQGADTFLSKFFISNPMLYKKEFVELQAMGFTPKVYVSPYSYVTTPWDMMVNEMLEIKRGDQRHGSCGCGFNETIERCRNHYPLSVGMLKAKHIKNILLSIRDYYIPKRIKDLDIVPDERYARLLKNDNILEYFFDAIGFFLNNTSISISPDSKYSKVIFEGAQGLMLDQGHDYFPHVTRSNTGTKNALRIMEDFHWVEHKPEIIYVTRCYATRHGVGPFPSEIKGAEFEDNTNICNRWQGKMRFGLVNIERLCVEIGKDLDHFKLPCDPSIAVTCLDQFNPIHCIVAGHGAFVTHEEFCMLMLADFCQFNKCYMSYGPSGKESIKIFQKG